MCVQCVQTSICVYTPRDTNVHEKRLHGRTGQNRDTAVQEKKLTRPYRKKLTWPCTQENAETVVTQLYSNKYLISYISCTFKRPVMFHKMSVKNSSENLKNTHKSAAELGTL